MKVTIFGANGPTGRLLTEQALKKGYKVTAVTRHPEAFPIQHDRLEVFHGDVYDLKSVEKAIMSQDAVLSSLGVPFSRKPISVYSQGIIHIIQAMQKFDVNRLICVSSSATEPHFDPQGGFIFERIVQPLIVNTIGKQLYEDMRRMEKLVKQSDLAWTIVRPSGLFQTQDITPYQVGETYLKGRFTSRSDLASSMLEELCSNAYLRKVMAVSTVSEQPSMLKLIMKEAFQGKSH